MVNKPELSRKLNNVVRHGNHDGLQADIEQRFNLFGGNRFPVLIPEGIALAVHILLAVSRYGKELIAPYFLLGHVHCKQHTSNLAAVARRNVNPARKRNIVRGGTSADIYSADGSVEEHEVIAGLVQRFAYVIDIVAGENPTVCLVALYGKTHNVRMSRHIGDYRRC